MRAKRASPSRPCRSREDSVTHYWLVDPTYKTLTVLERADRGYVIVLVAGPGDVVRALPFDGVEIPVAELFVDEETEEEAAEDPAVEPHPTSPP